MLPVDYLLFRSPSGKGIPSNLANFHPGTKSNNNKAIVKELEVKNNEKLDRSKGNP